MASPSPISTSSSAPSSTSSSTHKQPSRQEVINELIDEKVKIKEGKKFGVDPDRLRHRPVLSQAWARACGSRPISSTKSLESQGIRPETLKSPHQGRHGLEQPGARPLQGAACRSAKRKSLQRSSARRRRRPAGPGLRIPDAAGRADRAEGLAASVVRGAAARKPSRCARALQTCEEANNVLQVDAERRDPRYRGQDLRRHSAQSAQGARRHADRPSDAAGGDQAGRRDGRAVRAQADHGRHAEEARNPRQDVCREISRRRRRPICRKSAKPR